MRFSGLALVLLSALMPVASAAEPAPTCHGRAATNVGQPGRVLIASNSADVIVSQGAPRVRAFGGDDLICLTPPPAGGRTPARVLVEAGAGDDVVDATAAGARTVVDLGTGNDVFTGGPEADSMEEYADVGLGVDDPPNGSDRISTGGGDDSVVTGRLSGSDDVDLGPGDDTLTWIGPPRAATSIAGGGGVDHVVVTADYAEPRGDSVGGYYVFDTRHGEWLLDGRRRGHFDSFEAFDFSDMVTLGLTVVGGPAAETVRIEHSLNEDSGIIGRKLDLDMGAGDDRIGLYAALDPPLSLRLAGGPGRDLVTIGSIGPVSLTVDLARHWLQTAGVTGSITGIEDVYGDGNRVRLFGDAGPNRLVGYGSVVLRGRRGDDVLLGNLGVPNYPPATAYGGPGRDRCVARIQRHCENGSAR